MVKVIVSGHSRGLGEAVAAALLVRGTSVLGLARNRNARLAARFPDTFSEVALDLADANALPRWLETGRLGAWIDGAEQALLVNNAGTISPMGPPALQDPNEVARALALNVAAPLMLAAAFCAAAASVTDRRILHVSSGAARKPYPGWSVYCASKAALDHHARAVAEDKVAGLRICSLAPGVLDTEMQATIRATSLERFPLRERFAEMQRAGGLVPVDDCARRPADYLLGDAFGTVPTADLRDLPG